MGCLRSFLRFCTSCTGEPPPRGERRRRLVVVVVVMAEQQQQPNTCRLRNTNDGSKSSSVLKGHPHTLNDLEATQMKQALYQSGGGISTALLQDSVLLGSDTLASRQARQKWQQFKKGGWKPEGAREEEIEMDFIQREKL